MQTTLATLCLSLIVFSAAADNATDSREDKVMKAPIYNYNQPGATRDRGEVSETDLFLLGAIEKLTYRLDFIEKRLRRSEDLLFHVMEGQNAAHKQPGEKADPCPGNFTRAAGGCYFFSSDSSPPTKSANWKAAAAACKELGPGAALLELETVEETQDVVTHLKASQRHRDKSFWTGGLNPGLLWIWSDSGRPVSANGGHKRPGPSRQQPDIKGNGRCLLLGHDPAVRGYNLVGANCAAANYYICEAENNTTGQALERIQRNLRLFGNVTGQLATSD